MQMCPGIHRIRSVRSSLCSVSAYVGEQQSHQLGDQEHEQRRTSEADAIWQPAPTCASTSRHESCRTWEGMHQVMVSIDHKFGLTHSSSKSDRKQGFASDPHSRSHIPTVGLRPDPYVTNRPRTGYGNA
jgi:hypothetical protein